MIEYKKIHSKDSGYWWSCPDWTRDCNRMVAFDLSQNNAIHLSHQDANEILQNVFDVFGNFDNNDDIMIVDVEFDPKSPIKTKITSANGEETIKTWYMSSLRDLSIYFKDDSDAMAFKLVYYKYSWNQL